MKNLFATYQGQPVYEYIISSGQVEAHILNFGGIVKNLFYVGTDVVCGFDTIEDYLEDQTYQGSLVGRYANRIKKAQFKMDGKTYQLRPNEGANQLHGGVQGFNRKFWTVEKEEEDTLVLSLVSNDGEEGFPGNLTVRVTYTAANDGLLIAYEAVCDKKTPISLTNHSYFNLNGCGNGDVRSHLIYIDADKVTVVDDELIPTGEQLDVAGTPYDLRKKKEIGTYLSDAFDGYDTNYILNTVPKEKVLGYSLSKIAEVDNKKIRMEVFTDRPCVQLYTCPSLKKRTPLFKGGAARVDQGALCLETQEEPDGPNYGKGFLEAGEVYRTATAYVFNVSSYLVGEA